MRRINNEKGEDVADNTERNEALENRKAEEHDKSR